MTEDFAVSEDNEARPSYHMAARMTDNINEIERLAHRVTFYIMIHLNLREALIAKLVSSTIELSSSGLPMTFGLKDV